MNRRARRLVENAIRTSMKPQIKKAAVQYLVDQAKKATLSVTVDGKVDPKEKEVRSGPRDV